MKYAIAALVILGIILLIRARLNQRLEEAGSDEHRRGGF